ncbi:MAG: diguanylate cyclase [Oscillospiraceae bacterium]|nr:diguanylate cyclase [Oscillospiraceae bacterium]
MTPDILLYAELNLFCIAIQMLLAQKLHRIDKSIEQSYLISLLVGQSAMFFFDMIWVMVDGNQNISHVLNYLANILYFLSTVMCAYLCLRYVYLLLNGKEIPQRIKTLLLLPLWISTFINVCSIWTGWVFSINILNEYERGPLYIVQFLLPLVYLAADIVVIMHFRWKAVNSRLRKNAFILVGIMMLPILGATLETIFFRVRIVCVCMTIAMVAIIFDYQQLQITRDSLTQLSNRYDLLLHLEEVVAHRKKRFVYVIYADIDYFKSINDTYGHLEGDHALCHVADVLRNVCRSSGAFPARIGGDEFVIVFHEKNDEKAEKFRQNLKDAVLASSSHLPYELRMSAGMSKAEKGEEISKVLNRADAALYEEKKHRTPRSTR